MKIKDLLKITSIVAVVLFASVQTLDAKEGDSEVPDNTESGCAQNGKDGTDGSLWTNGQNGQNGQKGKKD